MIKKKKNCREGGLNLNDSMGVGVLDRKFGIFVEGEILKVKRK